jgi:hypothetical protein
VVEAGLVGAQGLELSPEVDVVQLLPLLQQPLQLFHLLLLLVDLACTRSKLLLLLGDSAGSSLGRCIRRRSRHHAKDNHGPLRWSLLLNHHWHCLRHHL